MDHGDPSFGFLNTIIVFESPFGQRWDRNGDLDRCRARAGEPPRRCHIRRVRLMPRVPAAMSLTRNASNEDGEVIDGR